MIRRAANCVVSAAVSVKVAGLAVIGTFFVSVAADAVSVNVAGEAVIVRERVIVVLAPVSVNVAGDAVILALYVPVNSIAET